ncbi:hypothetical protein BS47DRAFT_1367302 [Hydnum rufescens UP504]|uniref:Uncharacterized protein n=1 Tax=Hydnum rufescens UP504 TaxID=1448309 RepID=A0A9P6AIT5_9AGAM|nr:hypothetical protein BS47DRAFT_1367302 [Hydnum rufescens UP504]
MSSTLGHSSLPSANAKKPKTYQKSHFTSRKVAKESAEVEESSDGSEVPEKMRMSCQIPPRSLDLQVSNDAKAMFASLPPPPPQRLLLPGPIVHMSRCKPQPSVPSKQKPLSRSQIFTSRSQLHADNDVAYGSPPTPPISATITNLRPLRVLSLRTRWFPCSILLVRSHPMRLRSPVFDISSDDAPPSPQSDTPSQLLDEVRKINDPLKLLNEARELALRLPPSIPEACPGDFLHVWDATNVHAILLALPDGRKDPREDCEYIDCTLNHIFQGVSVSHLAEEMRQSRIGA